MTKPRLENEFSPTPLTPADPPVIVVGAGPAGLMAAEVLADAGLAVEVWDRKPSAARKFLRAGVGGLNLTHVDAFDAASIRYLERFGAASEWLAPALSAFDGIAIREWARSLGVETFIGSSGRVFPTDMKASPLLRRWIARIRSKSVNLRMRRRWVGFESDSGLRYEDEVPDGVRAGISRARAVVLALGGASWPQLGSDGSWQTLLAECGVPLAPLRPANCGFDIEWTAAFANRFAGHPVKSVAISVPDEIGVPDETGTHDEASLRRGEFVVSATGVEGSLVYAFATRLRERLAMGLPATIVLDLQPDRSAEAIATRLAALPASRSLAWRLKRAAAIDGVKAGLLREGWLRGCQLPRALPREPSALAAAIKATRLTLVAPRPIAEAISTAGGVRAEALDARFMLRDRPGVFCAGEMLDWEAPTGGYLLSASLATGQACARGLIDWLAAPPDAASQ